MTVYEGTIITCDGKGSVARYLVEDLGRILYVGDAIPAAYEAIPRHSLGEGALCPAFADTHIHFMSYALFSGGLDVRLAKSNREIAGLVSAYAEKSRERIILGFGASPHSVSEGTMITRREIDAACPDRPVFLVKYDGHAAVVNSALMSRLPAAVSAERGFDAEGGRMTQEAFFRATDFVTGTVSLPDTLDRMLRAMDTLASRGIALVHSVSGVGFPLDLDVSLESLFAKGLRNDMAYRIFFQTMDVSKVTRRKLPRIGGCFACALDGCFGSADAALNEPYSGEYEASAGAGVLYYGDETVRAFAKRANRAGLQIQMHAIGDRAFLQAATAIEAALEDFPRKDHRHTIIHACMPESRALEICAREGILIAAQPAFIQWDAAPLTYLERLLGPRAATLNPLGTMRKAGIVMTGGSDSPCTESDPLKAIEAAAAHYNPDESLSVQDALNLFTRNAAFGAFDDKDRGSLEEGKRADMVILDRNILAVPPNEIGSTRVLSLLVAGRPYRSGQGRLELLLRSLFSRRAL